MPICRRSAMQLLSCQLECSRDTHPSRHLACETRQPQLVKKGETSVSCDVTAPRLGRSTQRPQFPEEAGHESSSSHSSTPSLAVRHRPQMSAWMFTGFLITPPPQNAIREATPLHLSTLSARLLGSFDAVAEDVGPRFIVQSRQSPDVLVGFHLVAIPLNCDPATARLAEGQWSCSALIDMGNLPAIHHFEYDRLNC